MSSWGLEPWANDSAADWFAEVMSRTGLRDEWLRGINQDGSEEPEAVRAAAWLFLQLGRVYVWPIEHFDEDLQRTVAALGALTQNEEVAEDAELIEIIGEEITELQSRQD